MIHRQVWTDDMDDVVREAYRDRTRLAEVAQRLGVSRNAVIGRARRLGLNRPVAAVTLEIASIPWRAKQLKRKDV
jgi:hypothetical protein